MRKIKSLFKMNICFVIDTVFPSQGGLGTTAERFSRALERKGHKIVFIKARQKGESENFKIINGIKIYSVKSVKIPFSKYYVALPGKGELERILRKESIEVIHLLSCGRLAKSTIDEASKMKIPIVIGAHMQPENLTLPLHLNFKLTRKIVVRFFKSIWEKGECIITPSQFSKELIHKYGLKNKVFVISNGIDLSSFNKEKASGTLFRRKYNLEQKRFFLYVGRIMSEKNIGLIIRACKLIDWQSNPDLRFVIIGEGNKRRNLEKLAKKLGLEEKIIFTGKVDDEMLRGAYKESEILVHPSLIELEGMTLLEAMAFGKPLLVANSKLSAAPTLIMGNGELFDPFKPADLAKKMMALINDKLKLECLGSNSIKQARKYPFDKSVSDMENVFRSVAVMAKKKRVNIPVVPNITARV